MKISFIEGCLFLFSGLKAFYQSHLACAALISHAGCPGRCWRRSAATRAPPTPPHSPPPRAGPQADSQSTAPNEKVFPGPVTRAHQGKGRLLQNLPRSLMVSTRPWSAAGGAAPKVQGLRPGAASLPRGRPTRQMPSHTTPRPAGPAPGSGDPPLLPPLPVGCLPTSGGRRARAA